MVPDVPMTRALPDAPRGAGAPLRCWRKQLAAVIACSCVLVLQGCKDDVETSGQSQQSRGQIKGADHQFQTLAKFHDLTAESGIDFTFRDGQEAGHFAILELMGGGVALFDYDGDGLLDLFFTGGGRFGPNREILGLSSALFHNDGAMRFQNVSALAGVQFAPYYSQGAAVGDYNSDGFADLLMTGYGALALFCNQGDGTFSEIARTAGLADALWSTGAAWGDLNGDGVLDLYVAHYVNWSWDNNPYCEVSRRGQRDVCPPKDFEALPHAMYYGNGDGTFRDVSREAGLEPDGATGKGLGVVIADLDLDGRLDIYVGNDTTPNFLYHNLGEGKFEEIGNRSGTALSEMATPDGSMGVDVGDYNGDGLPDIWVSNFEKENMALYRNEGNCRFLHVSRLTGVAAVGTMFVGFGTLFFDFDRDGDEDVFVSNGHVCRHPVYAPFRQAPLLFENRGGTRFLNVASAAGAYLAEPHLGRGAAAGDIDNDGDLDLVVSHLNEPVVLLANESPNQNQWLQARLIGVTSHRDAVGARLTLTTSQGVQTRQVKGGGSYLSASDRRVFFGVPRGARIEKLSIRWPSGAAQEISDLAADRFITIIEH